MDIHESIGYSTGELTELIKSWYLIGAQDMLAEVIDIAQAIEDEDEFKKRLGDMFMVLSRNRGRMLRRSLGQDLS